MKAQITLNGVAYKHVFSRMQIMAKVNELAEIIKKDYYNSENPPLLIFVRNGGIFFGVDLTRALTLLGLSPAVDTIGMRRYNDENQGTEPNSLDWPSTDLSNRDIIVVEDLIDEGVSMNFLYQQLLNYHQQARSIKFCILLVKKNHVPLDFPIDYFGWLISPGWVIGNGMDSGQSEGRGLLDIYQAEKNS